MALNSEQVIVDLKRRAEKCVDKMLDDLCDRNGFPDMKFDDDWAESVEDMKRMVFETLCELDHDRETAKR